MGRFEFPVLQRNLKEWYERPWTDVTFASTKVGSTATVVKNSVLFISHFTFLIVACTFFPTTFLEIAVSCNWSSAGQTGLSRQAATT